MRTLVIALAFIVGATALPDRFSATLRAQLAMVTYVAEQAEAGKAAYAQHCESCHGANLNDGEFAPPLRSVEFHQRWAGKPADVLFDYMMSRMPPGSPGSLGDDMYAQILAFLIQSNRVPPGSSPLPANSDALAKMVLLFPPLGSDGSNSSGNRVSPGISLPPPPPRANPLDRVTPVTEAMLKNPPAADWLTWRRTIDAHGFSPLKQINKSNVGRLQTAWAWSLPSGPNEGTPIVHDGVMIVQGWGDKIQALDAATGDFLWQYSRRLPKGTSPSHKKAMAVFGHRIFVPTSDVHIVALDIKSGRVVWDSPALEGKGRGGMTGGPLVANGKIIVGTTGGYTAIGSVVAFDAESGKVAWRFSTIPRPGEPGDDTWNGLPFEKRTGGSVWTPPSYDPTLNLIFFGAAPTYDTGPLRDRVKTGKHTNEALYTDATIALNPDTGKLVWYFQHVPNDQWDLDWAFERQIVKLPVDGVVKPVVVTAGKPAIYEALDAATGKYVFSIDLGLQNFITAIDPKTGAKTIDPRKIPGDGEAKFVCPNTVGGRSWAPGSYNPDSKTLFAPLNESCMEYTPVTPGERGFLSTGVRLTLRPRPDSDGKYGRLQAINLETRKPLWTNRQRAALTTGTLATAGGLVFVGSFDRMFTAYDDASGKKLWSTRLNDVPSSNAITYAVNGKQYVAVIVGNGGPTALQFASLTPELVSPPDRSPMLWVFALPEERR